MKEMEYKYYDRKEILLQGGRLCMVSQHDEGSEDEGERGRIQER